MTSFYTLALTFVLLFSTRPLFPGQFPTFFTPLCLFFVTILPYQEVAFSLVLRFIYLSVSSSCHFCFIFSLTVTFLCRWKFLRSVLLLDSSSCYFFSFFFLNKTLIDQLINCPGIDFPLFHSSHSPTAVHYGHFPK